MSDIKVGDLVMVVRSHCPNEYIGRIFHVERIASAPSECRICRADLNSPLTAFGEVTAAVSWFRRIPPLAELNEAERKQSEPA